jgi:hypothetical protein
MLQRRQQGKRYVAGQGSTATTAGRGTCVQPSVKGMMQVCAVITCTGWAGLSC